MEKIVLYFGPNMKIEINPSTEEMISFLKDHGFDVKRKTVKMCWSVYHDDIECKNVKVWAVYKDKKEYNRPFSNFGSDEWVEIVFNDIFTNKLYYMVKNNRN